MGKGTGRASELAANQLRSIVSMLTCQGQVKPGKSLSNLTRSDGITRFWNVDESVVSKGRRGKERRGKGKDKTTEGEA